jgi:hypothetical protein
MDVFELRERVVAEYSARIKSFLRIDDAQIDDFVHAELARGHLWPDPLVHLNPAFEPGETVAALAQSRAITSTPQAWYPWLAERAAVLGSAS